MNNQSLFRWFEIPQYSCTNFNISVDATINYCVRIDRIQHIYKQIKSDIILFNLHTSSIHPASGSEQKKNNNKI